jgi:hypothetical protein
LKEKPAPHFPENLVFTGTLPEMVPGNAVLYSIKSSLENLSYLLAEYSPLSIKMRIQPGGWPIEFPDSNKHLYLLIRKIKKNTRSF